jgi:hypothetical protein
MAIVSDPSFSMCFRDSAAERRSCGVTWSRRLVIQSASAMTGTIRCRYTSSLDTTALTTACVRRVQKPITPLAKMYKRFPQSLNARNNHKYNIVYAPIILATIQKPVPKLSALRWRTMIVINKGIYPITANILKILASLSSLHVGEKGDRYFSGAKMW